MMTDRERLAVGLALSLAVHWLVMGLSLPAAGGGGEVVFTADLAPRQMGMSADAPLSLEAMAEPTEEDEAHDAEARRRLARQRYLDAVVRAVHDRRMLGAEDADDLAGNVLVAFTIDGAGRFSGVRMVRGSGDPDLDRDAVRAVRAASGVASRPDILGREAMAVRMAVKYQYGLE